MITLRNETDFSIDTSFLETILSSYTKRKVELIVTTSEVIKKLNEKYRNIDKPTDVLSFPLAGKKKDPLGSIVISIDFVNEAARRYGHTSKEEFALLFIHGMLHLLGFDHENDNGEMRKEEAKIIKKFGLPKSLIVRTEG